METSREHDRMSGKAYAFWARYVRVSYYASFIVSSVWMGLSNGEFGSGLYDFLWRLAVAMLAFGAIQWSVILACRRWPELEPYREPRGRRVRNGDVRR